MVIDADGHFSPDLHSDNQLLHGWLADFHKYNQQRRSDATRRLSELDLLGIDRQVLNPWCSFMEIDYTKDPDLSKHIMQTYNDYMLDIGDISDRFEINLWLAMQNIPASLLEIQRCMDRKFFGVFAGDAPCYGFMQDMEPIWELLDRKRIPFYLHLAHKERWWLPLDPQYEEMYKTLYNKLNRTWLTCYASILAGGVIDRYPNLNIILAERDISWVNDLRCVFKQIGLQDPLPALRRNFWYTVEPESCSFLQDAELLGWDRLLFSTDWPHSFDTGGQNYENDIRMMHEHPITEHERSAVFSENFLALGRCRVC